MRFGSVCSGIEAASVAWHPLGWKAAWLAEIEPFPAAVLAHHYPEVPNLGNMTALPDRIASGEVEAPDLFCGGTPCQAFSVAGLRKSLDDARGNLSLVFCEIANEIDAVRSVRGERPCIVFWENVPGVLNTKDNAFGCFLAGLAGEDDPLVPPGDKWTNAGVVLGPKRAVAWRVLDAQYFGVAQRRRRVFVVASARNDFDPAAVLFEFDGVRRDSPPSREAREGVAGGVEIGPGGGRLTELNPTLDTRAKDGPIRNQLAGAVLGPVAYALQHAQIGRKDSAGPQGKGWSEDVAFTQDSRSCADAVAIAFHPTQDPIRSTEVCHSIGANDNATAAVAHVVNGNSTPETATEMAFPLRADDGSGNRQAIQHAMQVRRLTPMECERLQGFPDGYTAIPWRKKPASECPDGPRYKALGNSWAVPVVRWIGKRIQESV